MLVATAVAMAQTGGGATLVGTVKDASGSFVAQASVTVVNTATSFVTKHHDDGRGRLLRSVSDPRRLPGDGKAAGFKEYVRDGLTLRSAEVPRVDIMLEVGAVTESVTVSAAASLLNTENVVSSYVLPAEVLKEVPGVMKRQCTCCSTCPAWSAF